MCWQSVWLSVLSCWFCVSLLCDRHRPSCVHPYRVGVPVGRTVCFAFLSIDHDTGHATGAHSLWHSKRKQRAPKSPFCTERPVVMKCYELCASCSLEVLEVDILARAAFFSARRHKRRRARNSPRISAASPLLFMRAPSWTDIHPPNDTVYSVVVEPVAPTGGRCNYDGSSSPC